MKFKSKVLEQPAPQPPAPAATPQPPEPAPQPPALAIRNNADPADPSTWPWVPRPVALRFRQLRTERDNARAVVRSLHAEQDAARARKRDALARLEAIAPSEDAWLVQRPRPELPDDHPEVVACKAKIADADSEIARLDALAGERGRELQQLARLVTNLEDYFSNHLRALKTVELYDGPEPEPLRKGETALDAVERCRRRVRELNADCHRIRSAPWQSAGAKARARDEIIKLAERGVPGVTRLIEDPNGSIYWKERPYTDVNLGGYLVSASGDPAALPLMFWLLRDTIIERVEREIDAVADDANALTAEQRAEQLAAAWSDLLQAQREEEHWLAAAVAGGATLLHRPDADPRAVLGLAASMPQP